MLAARNPLGLLSEDTHPVTGEMWGNFPQTYSMVGIINARGAAVGALGFVHMSMPGRPCEGPQGATGTQCRT